MKITSKQYQALGERLNSLKLQLKAEVLTQKIDRILNGGKGSGNFGHAGRPGEVGGSAPVTGSGKGGGDTGISEAGKPDITQHIANTAQANIDKAAKEEPEVTKDLGNVFERAGARFQGLDKRLKERESLARKIADDLSDKNLPSTNENIQKVANSINDNLRYTAILDKDSLVSGYEKIKKDLESQGYEMVKAKNTFNNPDSVYKGLNTQVRNKNGYVFELQFHTPQSFRVKMAQHPHYAIFRDKKSKPSARAKAERVMTEMGNTVVAPTNIDSIKSFNKLKA